MDRPGKVIEEIMPNDGLLTSNALKKLLRDIFLSIDAVYDVVRLKHAGCSCNVGNVVVT